jgi:hypothetical protein
MAALPGGFDGAPAPSLPRLTPLWRNGRGICAQGLARPTRLQRAEDGIISVHGQILTIDSQGHINNLSASRRPEIRASGRPL